MNEVVLDASALLALLNAEKGADIVEDLLPDAIISAANLSEVVTRLSAVGMPENEIRETLAILGLNVISFDEEQAYQSGLLYSQGKVYGLSLGDRACLALARMTAATGITADRAWEELGLGISLKLIR